MKLTSSIAAIPLALLFTIGSTAHNGPSQTDQRITDIAARSVCTRHNWPGRGFAPVGYIKGIALVYAKSLCESRGSVETAATVMRRPLLRSGEDSLVRYERDLQRSGIDASKEIERLRAVYTLGIGEGMRESSGNTTEGFDAGASRPPTAATAEAGLFQSSFDSINRSPALAKLFEQYKANPGACLLQTFMEGIPAREIDRRPVVGTGPGAEFQRFTRECPAFATEYAMVMFRVNRTHFGPIKRHEAEFFKPCSDMLKEVEAVVTCSP